MQADFSVFKINIILKGRKRSNFKEYYACLRQSFVLPILHCTRCLEIIKTFCLQRVQVVFYCRAMSRVPPRLICT